MPNARKGRLALKEAKLVKGIAAGKTVKQAAIDARISRSTHPETARVAAYEILRRPHVAAALDKALDEAGATIKATAQTVAAALKAEKITPVTFMGAVTDEHRQPDHTTRLKGVEMSWRARRLIGNGPEENGAGSVNLYGVLAVIKQASSDRGLPL